MFHMWRKFGVLLVLIAACSACSHMEPVYNVEQAPVPTSVQYKHSSEQIGKMIAKTAIARGWIVNEVKPGLLHCTLQSQGHAAAINIMYSKQDYSIELDSSENLKQSDGMIHRHYNKYIHILQNDIDKKLSQAAFDE